MSWLNDFVKVSDDVTVLSKKLANIGFEVEDIINAGAITNVVLGKICGIHKHPNADRLVVCDIDVGDKKLKIITGATNVSVHDFIPVALDKAVLPNGKVIKCGELRGVESQGMLCSKDELGLSDSVEDGIFILGNDKFAFALGTPISLVLGLDDYILDIAVPANRSDCQSVFGMAREIAALYNKTVKVPSLDYKTTSTTLITPSINVDFSVCNRYMGQVIKVEKNTVPRMIAHRLKKLGVNVYNSIVDITNYVLIETGQPLHSFDLSSVKDGISVSCGHKEQQVLALNDKNYCIDDSTVVVGTPSKVLAIAGIIGCKEGATQKDTQNVFLEAATFSRSHIRRCGKNLGLRTDSSSRFEKGVSFFSVEFGLKRALHLIDKFKMGSICKIGNVDRFKQKPKKISIVTSDSEINSLIGIKIPQKQMVKILTSLGFLVTVNKQSIKVEVPQWRVDIENFTDLSEEIIRFYGYDKLDSKHSNFVTKCIGQQGSYYENRVRLSNILIAHGFFETITYSFVDSSCFKKMGIKDSTVKIKNPLNMQQDSLRDQLALSMLNTIKTNLNRKNKNLALFEFAKTYTKDTENNYIERNMLCIAATDRDFFEIKALCMSLLGFERCDFSASIVPYFNPYSSVDIALNDQFYGTVGQIHPLILDNFDIDKKVVLAEIFVDDILFSIRKDIQFVPISKYPTVERDLSIIVKNSIAVGDIVHLALRTCEFPTKITLLDIYKGEQVPSECKSVSLKFELKADKTLTDKEIANTMNNVLLTLQENFDAKLR